MNEPIPSIRSIAKTAVRSVLSERYVVLGELASGGMGSVLYGRLEGPVGFARAVAIKRMHPHLACEPDFVSMFIDEARICARLSHVNIVPTLDVIEEPSELCLVMEYVHGASLDALLDASWQRGAQVPVRIAVALAVGLLHGLHAAHEARDEHGESLCIVHRDVSPQNALVGEDGVLRVLDFGIAKAAGKLRTTPSGEVKGKLAYMAPEQFRGLSADRRVDVRGAAAVLWETLVGRPLYEGADESTIVYRVLHDEPVPPGRARERHDEAISPELDAIVMRGLARDPERRFLTAREMALALERAVQTASQAEVSEWVRALIGAQLDARAAELRKLLRRHERGNEADTAARVVRGDSSATTPPAAATGDVSTNPSAGSRASQARVILTGVLVSALALGFVYLSKRPSATVDSSPRHGARELAPVAAPRPVEPAAFPTLSRRAADTATRALDRSNSSRAAQVEQASTVDDAGVSAQQALEAPRSARRQNARPERHDPNARPATAASRVSCSPPYWWSADGVKHYKRECL